MLFHSACGESRPEIDAVERFADPRGHSRRSAERWQQIHRRHQLPAHLPRLDLPRPADRCRHADAPFKCAPLFSPQCAVGGALIELPAVVATEEDERVVAQSLGIERGQHPPKGRIEMGQIGQQQRPPLAFAQGGGRRGWGERAMDGVECQIEQKRFLFLPPPHQPARLVGKEIGGEALLYHRLAVAMPVELAGLFPLVRGVVDGAAEEAIEGIEATGLGKILRAAPLRILRATEMPFAAHPGLIAGIVEGLRQDSVFEIEAAGVVDTGSGGGEAGEECCAGHAADRIDHHPLEPGSVCREPIEMGRFDGGVVPADVAVAMVVGDDDHDIRPRGCRGQRSQRQTPQQGCQPAPDQPAISQHERLRLLTAAQILTAST